jgi:hypothetical protein
MFSRPLLGTNKETTKLSWFEYVWFSCIQQGWYNCFMSFKNWADLMGGNLSGYAILKSDDPLECCLDYFWDSLEDDIYPKHFLEDLMQMSYDVKMGKGKLIPFDSKMFDELKDLVEELIDIDLDGKV